MNIYQKKAFTFNLSLLNSQFIAQRNGQEVVWWLLEIQKLPPKKTCDF